MNSIKAAGALRLDTKLGDQLPPTLLEESPVRALYSPDQPRDEHGRWTDDGGWEHTGITWQQPTDPKTGRPIPIKVRTVEEAVTHVLNGKVWKCQPSKNVHAD